MTFENLIICPQGLRFTRYPRKIFYYHEKLLTDTGEDSKLVHRRICPEVDVSIFFSFFPTRPSDQYDSAPSRKCSRPLLDLFACIG